MRQSFLMNERIYLRAVEPEDMDIMYDQLYPGMRLKIEKERE